jgi:hypothetical protein
MLNSKKVIFCLLIILVGAFIFCNCSHNKKREGYANVYYNKGLDPTTLTRSTFNSNLDPRNMNMRSDPNVYGGYIKGSSPGKDNLASYNKVASYLPQPKREGFADQTTDAMNSGKYTGGMNDALSYVEYIDTDYDGLPGSVTATTDHTGVNDYKVIDNDFAYLASDGTFQSAQRQSATQKYKASLSNKNPDTLKYTTPQELLPAPDMRQPLMRDPSDPSNFMYDRTIFAPLKKRNHNEADRIRGDLDIEPVKTGWFDIATIPTVDLVKGYFGYYNDIQEYQDLQDITYARQQREATGEDATAATQKLTATMAAVNQDMMRPSLKYAVPPHLDFGPMEPSYKNANPWYNTISGNSKRDFEL